MGYLGTDRGIAAAQELPEFRRAGGVRRTRGALGRRAMPVQARGWGSRGAMVLAVGLGLMAQPAKVVGEQVQNREVPVVANSVFPYENPAETYRYYSLPFCKEKQGKERQAFGELLVGDRKEPTNYHVYFRKDMDDKLPCDDILGPKELTRLSEAIKENYHYEFFVDGIPVMGPIGMAKYGPRDFLDPKVLLYTHIKFTLGYNGEQVVSAKVDISDDDGSNPPSVDITDVSAKQQISWTYRVEWKEDLTAYKDRIVDTGLFPRETFEIHWLSILNSFVLVVILTVLLAAILLRVIKNDFSRYMEVDEDDIGEEESGWKLIHGDVFRFPSHLNLFAALNGAGAQLCTVMLLLLGCALLGVFKVTKRGSTLTCGLVLYSMTSWVSGFVSARLYRQLGGRSWVWNAITVSMTFPGPLLLVFSVVNSIAWSQASTAAIPFYPVVSIVAMFVFITFPLTVIGAIIGRHTASDFVAPCRTTRVPRQVPKDVQWFRRHPAQMFVSGFLPFTAIYIELHYIFGSVWGHQIYTMFGILILAFALLVVVCGLITVALVYFQLGREDHRWWWPSFCFGGSTGLFVYAFSFFYFFNRSEMHGLLQSAIYFGYTAVVSYAFFVMLGFVGFVSSLTFVKRIYSVLKCD